MFFPHIFPESFVHWFGGAQTDESRQVQWLCVFLHLGSILYTWLWGFFSYLIVRSFYPFIRLVVSDVSYLFYYAFARGSRLLETLPSTTKKE